MIVLADACERADEIDIARAEEARKRAQETMKAAPLTARRLQLRQPSRRSFARLKAAERKRRKPHGPGPV